MKDSVSGGMGYTAVLETAAERIESSSLSLPTKFCKKCMEEKPESDFAWKIKSKGTRQSHCKKCHASYSKLHYKDNTEAYREKSRRSGKEIRERNTEYVMQFLRQNCCVDCGESDIEVLQFDHIEMVGSKGKRVSAFMGHSLEVLQSEISKCEVRCANCHVRRTRRQLGWERTVAS